MVYRPNGGCFRAEHTPFDPCRMALRLALEPVTSCSYCHFWTVAKEPQVSSWREDLAQLQMLRRVRLEGGDEQHVHNLPPGSVIDSKIVCAGILIGDHQVAQDKDIDVGDVQQKDIPGLSEVAVAKRLCVGSGHLSASCA